MEDVTFIIKDGGRREVITLKCDPQNKEIAEIKMEIEKKYGYPVQRQSFYFRGEQMQNDNILNDFSFTRDDHIDVDVIPAPYIEIVGPDKTIHVDYNCYDRVESLFQQVTNLWKLEERRINLVSWKNVKLLNKHGRLSEYDIDGNDKNRRKVTLQVLAEDTIRITVQSTDGGALNINISSSDTVLNLKERIGYFETRKTEEIRLMFHGKQLSDNATLNSRGIVDGSVVYSLSRGHGGG